MYEYRALAGRLALAEPSRLKLDGPRSALWRRYYGTRNYIFRHVEYLRPPRPGSPGGQTGDRAIAARLDAGASAGRSHERRGFAVGRRGQESAGGVAFRLL
ncbi:MAG: hypothetical protein HC802_03840 [Caldilineaceae bacterium]|nr:hypothetical protein [Caldilineaceae bacterium]